MGFIPQRWIYLKVTTPIILEMDGDMNPAII